MRLDSQQPGFHAAHCRLFALIFLLASCVCIPQKDIVMSSTGQIESPQGIVNGCAEGGFGDDGEDFSQTELGALSISVLNWNILKGDRRSWNKDFQSISSKMDLLLIQEAYLNENVLDGINGAQMGWVFSPSFFYAANNVPTGVLTASHAQPIYCRALRAREPIIRTPKSSLITKYRLTGENQVLLVANVHAINFSLGARSYKSQAFALKQEMQSHPGPIILAGDFNTWSEKRLQSLHEVTEQLGLQPVQFPTDHRKKVFKKAVDHIFYRGLTVANARVLRVRSSDHNPMLVDFRLSRSRSGVDPPSSQASRGID